MQANVPLSPEELARARAEYGPQVGDTLVAKFKGVTYHADVRAADDGRLAFEALDGPKSGTIFKSLSAAGKAITQHECNGWAFWSVQREEAVEAPVKVAKAKAPRKARAKAEPVAAAIEAE
jgi:hypothetical protein